MICPFCGYAIPEAWMPLMANLRGGYQEEIALPVAGGERGVTLQLRWMRCSNGECGELLVKARHQTYAPGDLQSVPQEQVQALSENEWYVLPRYPLGKGLQKNLPADLRIDYEEANAILDLSARMSAVLSPRILAEVLKRHAGRNETRLICQIDRFLEDPHYPPRLKDNLDYLRAMGDFAAHAIVDEETGAIIAVERTEAAWALEVIDSLFDYFIVAPAKDLERREAFDAKNAAANRKPLR